MLVLGRKINETIVVDGPCVIHICAIRYGDTAPNVRVGIIADPSVNVRRGELEPETYPTTPKPVESVPKNAPKRNPANV